MMRRFAPHILIFVLIAFASCAPAEEKIQSAISGLAVAEVASGGKLEASEEVGVSTSEVLPGNGTRAGYVLGHGNIVPGSEWVYIGTRRGSRNHDYTIDYSSGTLFFTEAVRQMDSVRVDYRYSEKSVGERSVTGPGSLPFAMGKSGQLNMLYSYRAADPALGPGVPDVLTYGMSSNFTVGASSKLTGMVYMATPQMSNRMTLAVHPSKTALPAVAGQPVTKVKKDRLVVQNADLGLGKMRIKLGFQDVGEGFAGFASMRDAKAAPADVINQLEKEKGIQRMDIAGEMPSGVAGKLSFSVGQIEDKTGEINSRAFSYAGDRFKVNFSTREVDKTFVQFLGLRESDSAQMALETGIKRTNYGFQFRTGFAADKSPIWSGVGFTQLDDGASSLSYRTVDLELSRVKLQADVRSMDPGFNRMYALNDEERARMALIARRQFNPKAPMAEVTAVDKAAVVTEAGLDRSTYVVQVDGGPLNTWLSLSNVDSDKGGLNRRSINISTGRFSAYFNHQSVDETFRRLANLQPTELLHFGNEYGMTRTETGGTLKIAGGEAGFTHKSVTDFQGASVLRESLDFKSSRLSFRANVQDIDPRFTRIMDLADADKAVLLQERGFRRSDYWMSFQATKALTLGAYIYDSTNPLPGQTRGQSRYTIDYAPTKDRKITLLQDDHSFYSEAGKLESYSRRKMTFDNKFNLLGGLTFKSLSNANIYQQSPGHFLTTSVDQYRVESNQNAKMSFAVDQLKTEYGDGRGENTRSMGIKVKPMQNLALQASYATTERKTDKSEAGGSVAVEWAIKKDLAFKMSLNNREGGPTGEQHSKVFSLNGVLAKRLLFLDNVKISSGINETELQGKQIGYDDGIKMEAGLMGGKLMFDNSDKFNPTTGIYYHSRLFQYESDKDPKRWHHLTVSKQELTTPLGLPAEKRNYAFDMRLTQSTNLTLTSYQGQDGLYGVVLPVGGTVFKVSHKLRNGITLIGDYTSDVNGVTHRRARVAGLGFHGTLSNKAAVELYYGRCLLDEGLGALNKNVFRIKYDHKVNSDHFISLSAERKSGVAIGSINPFEGDTVGRIEFRTTFD